jgi:hypothetical protein
VALTPATLLRVAKDDKTEGRIRFRAIAEFIGTKSAEIYSHVNVATQFLDQVWGLGVSDTTKMACSSDVLEHLLRFRTADYGDVITMMRSMLAHNWKASGYLEAWIGGHFLEPVKKRN